MGDEKKPDCVKVAVRLRPLSSKELGNNEESIIELEEQTSGADGGETGSVTINDPEGKEKPGNFAFDIVFGTATQQDTVYQAVGKAAVASTLSGYNGTIFAYGQTGSGKSWCMMGGPGDLKGIIPRVNEQIFVKIDELQQEVSTRRFLVMCSFFEIYNEIIFDLLNPVQDRSKMGAGLQVKEHPVLGIYVKDLQEIVVSDADKLEKLMNSGTKNRAVSSTMMNAVSSRSHSIFTIKVHQKDDEDKSKNVFAKLNLVDLAGSERQKGTGASGQTLKEGANINKSLSALGNVINALVEIANGKKVFVPFRNSKLTRVLQESLGGNSLTTMLATLSPAACNYEETMSTLRYANRAKAIKVSATKNEEASQISRLNAEIEELKKKLQASDSGGGGGGVVADEERKAMQEKFQAQLADMQNMVSGTWEEKAKMSADHEAQLSKALEEQKKQARAMQEECRKRLRLLEDQNDLELSIRGLIDTLQSLPSKAEADEAASEVSLPPLTAALRSCELPRQWLKLADSVSRGLEDVKKEHTMAVVFQSAFREDLRLWVDSEEACDHAMARTGARRALTKLETLKRETARLSSLEANARCAAQEFAQAIYEARREWLEAGLQATTEELKQAHEVPADSATAPGEGSPSAALDQSSGLPPLETQVLDDIGRIMLLIEKQARAKAAGEFDNVAGLEAQPLAELVLRGAELVNGVQSGPDEELLRSFVASDQADVVDAGDAEAAKLPREERPLHEWSPNDVDDSPEGTEYVISQVVSLDSLNKKRSVQELLARPPPKFVHDVALLVQQATGYMQAMSNEWPESNREARVDLLQYIADSVSSSLGLDKLTFDPADVLKGKEVANTLRLLQLLAVAASRSAHQPNGGSAASKVSKERKADSKTTASEMAPFLDAVSRCLQTVMERQAARGDMDGGHASPSRELDANYRSLQDRLEAEMQQRKKNEERLVHLQQEEDNSRRVLAERNEQLEQATKAAVKVSGKKEEMQKQLEDYRKNLLDRASQIQGNSEVENMRREIEELTQSKSARQQEKLELQSDVTQLQKEQVESDMQRETLEMEVERMKARAAEGLDGPVMQSEELLYLQAEKQKLDMQIASLDEKMRLISEEEDSERQHEAELVENKKVLTMKSDDLQMQLQVMIEERDGLREGMDLLWQQKTRLEEELDNVSEGYTHLSDRLFDKMEEARELEEQLQQYDNLVAMLQENYEKHRASPSLQVTDVTPPSAPPPPPEDDGGSSHYSDDEFEEPDED